MVRKQGDTTNSYEDLAVRLSDLLRQSERYHKPVLTAFLTEGERAFAEGYLKHRTPFAAYGGYVGAERQRILINDTDDSSIQAYCICLTASYHPRFVSLSHRDLLGAVMNLKIERSQIGDMWTDEESGRIVIYTTDTMAPFLMQELEQVGRAKIQLAISSETFTKEVKTEDIELIIASYRLDVIVSALGHCSRSQAQEMIRTQRVSVNHVILEEADFLCHNGDTVSIRRVGRFIIKEQLHTTKKDRLVVLFQKYV